MGDKKATENQRRVISTREEMRRAAVEIAKTANRSLAIFTHDLEPGIYDDLDFLEVVKRLILSRAYARVRVLIADPSRAIKNGNRFVHLGRRLNSFIEFRHVREDYRTHKEAYCIADGGGIVYRLDAARWEGIVDRNVPAVTDMYLTTFDEIWHASEVEHEFRRLNI
ncbi:MAG: hypothetical protein GVY21_01845 [Gammaproteobacteria bacterium]|jgi:hypothetical protein|nr:hypothetical protein [Gammaproteobacteria bacterium]